MLAKKGLIAHVPVGGRGGGWERLGFFIQGRKVRLVYAKCKARPKLSATSEHVLTKKAEAELARVRATRLSSWVTVPQGQGRVCG